MTRTTRRTLLATGTGLAALAVVRRLDAKPVLAESSSDSQDSKEHRGQHDHHHDHHNDHHHKHGGRHS